MCVRLLVSLSVCLLRVSAAAAAAAVPVSGRAAVQNLCAIYASHLCFTVADCIE